MEDNIDRQVEDLFLRYGIENTEVTPIRGGPTLFEFWNKGYRCFFVAGDFEGDEVLHRASILAGGLPKDFPFREDNYAAVVAQEKLRWQKWQHIRERDALSCEVGLVGTRMGLKNVIAETDWMEMPKKYSGLNYIPTPEYREKWRAMRTVWPNKEGDFWIPSGSYIALHGVRLCVESGYGVRLRVRRPEDAVNMFADLRATYSYNDPKGERKRNLRTELQRLREQVEVRERELRSLEGK